MAIFCGLAAGRYRILQRKGWDINAKGLMGAPPIRVITGKHTHSSVKKAIALLGLGLLGRRRRRLVPVDGHRL